MTGDTNADDDEQIVTVLDAVDRRTAIQTEMWSAMQNGFIHLARERYRDPLSIYRTLAARYRKQMLSDNMGEVTCNSECVHARE